MANMDNPRESIFVNGLRSFCSALFGTIGAIIGLILIVFLFMMCLSGPHMRLNQTMISIEPDANGQRKILSEKAPVVLKIDLQGVIGVGNLTSDEIQRQLDDSQGFALTPGRVKAVLLTINSPGGAATDSDNLYCAIEAYKKKYNVPVYAFVDGICASGAVYAACAADKIISTPVSILGSVGVLLGPNFNVYDLMQKVGVKEMTLTEGKDKDAMSPFRPWKENEDESLRDITTYLYERFVTIVAQNRPKLTVDKLKNEYGAHVFAAPKAEELGYCDDISGTYSSALTALVEAAKIEGDYQVVSLEPQKQLLKEIIKNQSPLLTGKVKHQFFDEVPASKERFFYLFQP